MATKELLKRISIHLNGLCLALEIHLPLLRQICRTPMLLLQVPANAPLPPARGGHASVAVGTKVIVFGGANRAATPFTDLWVLETGKPIHRKTDSHAEPQQCGGVLGVQFT